MVAGSFQLLREQRNYVCQPGFRVQVLTVALERPRSGYEEDIDRKQQLLDMISNPDFKRRRAVCPADVQQLLTTKEKVPTEQQWSSSLDRKGPETPHIKEEQEDNKELGDRTGDGGAGSDSHRHSQPDFNDKTSEFSEPESNDTQKDRKKTCRTFCCSECGKTFKQRASLKTHKRTHTGEKPFSCSVCGKRFTQRVGLCYHLKIHTGEKPFSCSVCGKSYRQKAPLKSHMLLHTGMKPFSCSVCNKRFRSASQVKTHKCVVWGEESAQVHDKPKKPLKCGECDQTFPNNYLLTTHMRIHKGKTLFTCTVCGAQRQFSSQMVIHMRRHTGERPYSCSICGKTFTQRGIMLQHVAVHSGVKPFSCSRCGRRFSWHFQIKTHKCSGMTQLSTASFNGTGCGGSQSGRTIDLDTCFTPDLRTNTKPSIETDDSVDIEFWTDIRKHQSGFTYQRKKKVSFTENKPFSCSDGEVEIEAKNNGSGNSEFYKQSRQSCLSNLKTEPCNTDRKRCEEHRTLQTHMRCHKEEKLFSCYFCGKGFASSDSLTRHISLHKGEKFLSCIICENIFMLESELQSHTCVGESSKRHQSQTEEVISANKLLSCSQCGQTFGRKQQLQVHMRIHKAENQFSCSVCGKIFSKRGSLTSHMTCHTEENSICCSVCNSGFSDKESLIQHMRIHTQQTQFTCLVCGKEFAWRRHLMKHMGVHAEEEINRGSICEESREGEAVVSSSTEYTETDDSGDGNFWTESRPQQSDLNSTENKVFQSNVRCKSEQTLESFNSQRDDSVDSDFYRDSGQRSSHLNLVNHAEVCGSYTTCDSDRKPLSCSESSEALYNKNLLEVHTRLHAGEKMLTSSFYAEQFTESLSQRLAVHTGEQGGVKQEPEPPHIKEEQEEQWSSQEGEQLQGLEEADTTKFPFTAVPVKSEDDEEKPQSSQLHHSQTEDNRETEPLTSSSAQDMETGADGEDCGGPQTDWNSHPHTHLQQNSGSDGFWTDSRRPQSDVQISDSNCEKRHLKGCDDKASETDSDDSVDSDFWKESRKPQLSLDSLKSPEVLESEIRSNVKKPFSCSECGKGFLYIYHMKAHVRGHKEERPFLCSVCGQTCHYKSHLKIHMRTHTGEKPFSCPVCGRKYAHKASMQSHMMVHTLENCYSCSVCDKSFGWFTELKYHQCVGGSSHPPFAAEDSDRNRK